METDRSCQVRVLGTSARTSTVHGHHYALVEIDGLSPGSTIPYEVVLDGERVWPEPESPFPPSQIRTLGPSRALRLAFGSCRADPVFSALRPDGDNSDVLDAFAERADAEPAGTRWSYSHDFGRTRLIVGQPRLRDHCARARVGSAHPTRLTSAKHATVPPKCLGG